MTDSIRVFVNASGLDAPSGATVLDAVRLFDPAAAAAVIKGERMVTDSRGLPVSADAPVYAGAILRLVANRGHVVSAPDADV